MQDAILSLDIGTSLTKAVLFGPTGRELDVAEHAYPLHMPTPDKVELDPQEMWEAVVGVIKTICDRHNPNVHILALTLSTQGGTLLPVGADNTPTHHAITWLDRRSEEIVRDWRRQGVDQRIRQISGWGPQPGLPLASICALRRSQPEAFANTRKFLSVNDFIVHQLTGDYCTNPSMAGEMLLTDIQTGAWSHELCDLAGLNIDQLSPFCPPRLCVGSSSLKFAGKQVCPKAPLSSTADRTTLAKRWRWGWSLPEIFYWPAAPHGSSMALQSPPSWQIFHPKWH